MPRKSKGEEEGTKRSRRPQREILEANAAQSAGGPPVDMIVFPSDFDNRVPGEIIVKLDEGGEFRVTESIAPGPLRRIAGPISTSFGIGALDELLAGMGVTAITKVHGPMPTQTLEAAEGVGIMAQEMSATYRVQLADPGADLEAAAQRIAENEAVIEAEPNLYRFASVIPNDPMFSVQWGFPRINCPSAWDRTKGSASVTVAVVDSGIDLDHPDLQPLLVPGWDAVDITTAPPPGFRFEGDNLTRDNNPQDEVGHGTHVAGTISAVSNNNVGVTGVTWFCKLMPVKVLTRLVRISDGAARGTGTAVDVAAGIRWAVDHGAHIINMSFGSSGSTFVERDAVAYAVSRGVLMVAAMGNDGTSNPSFPAAYPNVVSVGATDRNDKRAAFSQTGSHIDLVAPGVDIRSTDWDNTYSNKSGTSMATPHVSGVAALVKSCKMTLTAAEIAQILRDSARNLRDSPSDPVPNDRYGFGLVEARAAVDRACPPPPTLKFRDDGGTLKFGDDGGTLKFQDDNPITFRFQADTPTTLKFSEDIAQDDTTITFTFRDANPITFKFWDDGQVTLKFREDSGTFKFIEDNPPSSKFQEDIGTGSSDVIKPPPVDKPPSADLRVPVNPGMPPIQPPVQPGSQSQAPFILATPHHSMAWTAAFPQAAQALAGQYEAAIAQYEATLNQLAAAHQQGIAVDPQQVSALYQEYQALLADYQQLSQQAQQGQQGQ